MNKRISASFTSRFLPTLADAQARIAALQPAAYARTRNALDGAVSQLSPYITHGFVSLADVLAGVTKRHSWVCSTNCVRHQFWS
jgi:deoxyribodipyrimidine photo-lyase